MHKGGISIVAGIALALTACGQSPGEGSDEKATADGNSSGGPAREGAGDGSSGESRALVEGSWGQPGECDSWHIDFEPGGRFVAGGVAGTWSAGRSGSTETVTITHEGQTETADVVPNGSDGIRFDQPGDGNLDGTFVRCPA